MGTLGQREQKRQATRSRLIRTAQRLFLQQGFEQTTVDEIAAEAGISRRTFFHYFASKEDVVLSRYDDFERTLVAAIQIAPPEQNILHLAEQVVSATLSQFDPADARVVEQLKRDTPALRVRDQGKYERLERAIASALADRTGVAPDDLGARLDSILIAGVLRIALEGWIDAGTAGVPTSDHVHQVVSALSARLKPASSAPARR